MFILLTFYYHCVFFICFGLQSHSELKNFCILFLHLFFTLCLNVLSWDHRLCWQPGVTIVFHCACSAVVWGRRRPRHAARGRLGLLLVKSLSSSSHISSPRLYMESYLFFFLASFHKQREPHPTWPSRNQVAVSRLTWSTLTHHQELCFWERLLLLGPEASLPSTPRFWSASGAQRYLSWVAVQLCPFVYHF